MSLTHWKELNLTARPSLPFALQPKVEAELTCLTELWVISPVEHSDWATPVVAFSKKDAMVRFCGDFKVIINQALCVDRYPMPWIEDLYVSLAGGQRFGKLDMSNAYLQMELEEESIKLVTNDLSAATVSFFASALALFQKAMDQVLPRVLFIYCYLDDILISWPNEKTHQKPWMHSWDGWRSMACVLNRSVSFSRSQWSVWVT